MTTLPQGKGAFVWQPDLIEGGSPSAAVAHARIANFGHVIFKVANDIRVYPFDSAKRVILVSMIQAFKAAGIQVWGYGYVYGDNPTGEAAVAIQQINELGLIGYYIDAEGEYKQAGKATAATVYMKHLRAALPSLPIGLCSYRWPSYHRELPWREFREYCNFDAPQVYWVGKHDPISQLNQSYAEFQAMIPWLPFVPVGSAYIAGMWSPTVADWVVFLDRCRILDFAGASFWEWAHTRAKLPAVWDAIAAYPWPVDIMPPPPPPPEPEPEPEHAEIMASLMNVISLLDTAHGKLDILRLGHADILVKLGEQPAPLPPIGVAFRITALKSNLRFIKETNANGAPIMQIYPSDSSPTNERIQRFAGDIIHIALPSIKADGGALYYQVVNIKGRSGETLYVSKADGIQA